MQAIFRVFAVSIHTNSLLNARPGLRLSILSEPLAIFKSTALARDIMCPTDASPTMVLVLKADDQSQLSC